MIKTASSQVVFETYHCTNSPIHTLISLSLSAHLHRQKQQWFLISLNVLLYNRSASVPRVTQPLGENRGAWSRRLLEKQINADEKVSEVFFAGAFPPDPERQTHPTASPVFTSLKKEGTRSKYRSEFVFLTRPGLSESQWQISGLGERERESARVFLL